jgi:peptide/nickel transport system ATP-binding protein
MEKGPADRVFASPSNPYTQGLLATIPEVETRKKLTSIPGQIPDLTDVPEGCIFADRCRFAEPACREGAIETEAVDEHHETRCLRWETAVENPIEPDEVPDRQSARGERILEVSDLHKHYDVPGFVDSLFGADPPVKAVNGVDLSLYEGESLALVGESGCGKSTLGRTILGLVEATSGEVSFRGDPMSEMTDEEYRRFRSECQVVFQNPESSLNPRKSVFNIIARPLRVFTDYGESERRERVAELLSQVGLSPAYASRHPHELSGGEQQRIAIARAFAAEPSFVVLDEPVSSLDVSVQANILDLLDTLRDRYNTSYLFISHDLSVVRHLCDQIAVMYLGEIVETGAVADIFDEPRHPYTEALIESIPSLDPTARGERMATLEGEVPSPRDPPTGCKFHTRCPYAREACTTDEPEDVSAAEDDDDGGRRRQAACFRTDDDHAYWSSDPLERADPEHK